MYRNNDIIDSRSREYWENVIFQWVHDELARKILEKHLLDGLSYERIAEDLEISRATVYNKVSKYSPRVFQHSD